MWGMLGINVQGMLEINVRKMFGMLGSFDGCKYTWMSGNELGSFDRCKYTWMLGMNVSKGIKKLW